jgi:hypothetical protein
MTYSSDFSTRAHADEGRGGLASPAIGADGTIYVISTVAAKQTSLRAYGGIKSKSPARQADTVGIIGE